MRESVQGDDWFSMNSLAFIENQVAQDLAALEEA